MWHLPGPGLKPVSPALAGGFLTTAPPGKSLEVGFEISFTSTQSPSSTCKNSPRTSKTFPLGLTLPFQTPGHVPYSFNLVNSDLLTLRSKYMLCSRAFKVHHPHHIHSLLSSCSLSNLSYILQSCRFLEKSLKWSGGKMPKGIIM